MKRQMPSQTIMLFTFAFLLSSSVTAQQPYSHHNMRAPSLNIEKGKQDFSTKLFTLELLNSSQTVAALRTNDKDSFDFTPGDRLKERDSNGFYHLGDITLAFRTSGSKEWTFCSTSRKRADIEPIKSANPAVIAAADLSNTLPSDMPVKIIRYWEKEGENIILRFEIKNLSENTIELGSLGIPMVFNNNFNDRSLDEAHAGNVFFDPYIGNDAGYLQVIRLNGLGKVLVVVPCGDTPFEAYRPLTDDPLPPGHTYEGLHEWMVHSRAYAETQWKGVEQWNEPTLAVLAPGETKSYGVKFLLAPSVREIENTLEQAGRPVAMGVPGYVLPMDVKGSLFIKYGSRITSMKVEPQGALEITQDGQTKNGWKKLTIKGTIWGRARLIVDYDDGLSQTINYKVIEPEKEVIASYGHFLTTEQWYENDNDLFGRSPSVITYDYEEKKPVLQDIRVWIAGLGDEGGAGGWLGAIMKQLVEPDKEEVAKLERFVQETVWGGLQYSEGEKKYGVRKSMFYYEPDSMPEGTYDKAIGYLSNGRFPSWNKKEATSTVRSYDYPHVAAAHWVMYRLARNYRGLVTRQTWQWYLENAFQTTMAMIAQAPVYAEFGQMEGSVFILILNDLKAEGMSDMAAQMEAAMKSRVDRWMTLKYPFGSEMPWDSTGQEEVYMWAKYFGLDDKALVTLNAILAYMPSVPHWAYNGNARRFWDFLYGGKLKRFERMIHHYGSALNAIPVLNQYREYPSDFYLLRVGYGGLMGSVSNITQDGFAPCAFHSFPSTLKNDGISGDYGTGFYGYAVNTSTYITYHDEFGWLSYGGNCSVKGKWVTTELTTAARNRVYIAPEGLWITLDAGQLKSVSYNKVTGMVKLEFDRAKDYMPEAYMHISTPEKERTTRRYSASQLDVNDRGAYVVMLGAKHVTVVLKPL